MRDLSAIKNELIELIKSHGPLAIPEIAHIISEDPILFLKTTLDITSLKIIKKKIKLELRELVKEQKIKHFECDSGYKIRYGMPNPHLDRYIPMRVKPKIILKKCDECLAFIITLSNKIKHISCFFCNSRDQSDDANIYFLNYDDRKFILYQNFFLGVFDNGKIRLPFKNNKTHEPEFFIALKKFNKKIKSYRTNKYLKLNLKEYVG
ncbi:hypothetical protein LCGC14_1631760 [marine sediment metagenome]|uniref:Uncharacterized protein n=1 Tax=marine sediment metagenome TaxID=412755 RepID=A0A0F9I2E5_9ZZZZ